MKSAAHQYEDKLLEFAYGELPQHEADAVDAHVRGCSRCAHSLSEIRGVRATMAKLPMESAPDAGLESLLAYAEQAAQRTREAKAPPSIWKRFLMPLASVMALATVGVIAFRANQDFDTSRASAAADTKLEERAEKQKEQWDQSGKSPVAQGEAMPTPAPAVVAAVSPPAEAPANDQKLKMKSAQLEDGKNSLDDLREAGGKRGDVWSPEPKAAVPQSVTRRISANKTKAPSVANDEGYRQDFSNAAQRGALSKDSAPPPPPQQVAAQDKVTQEKVTYGLGTSNSGGAVGGLDIPSGRSAGPGTANAPVAKPAPAPVKEQPAFKEEAKKRAKTEEEAPARAEAQAPVAAAPMPSSAPYTSSPKKMNKGSLGVHLGDSASSGAEDDSMAVQKSDSLGVDRDAKFAERGRAQLVTQSLESARVASNNGDRLSEIRLLAQVLQNGATGYQRVEALKRICDAYEALGEPDRADPFCDQLLSEFPATAAARAVSDRRKQVQRAPAPAPSKNSMEQRERKALSDEAKPAEQAPASAY
jgi:hypothetical protein